MFMLIENGEWEPFRVTDGVFQGECLSTLVFCVSMHNIIVTCLNSLPEEVRPVVHFFAYIDDVVICTPPEHFQTAWRAWQVALHAA